MSAPPSTRPGAPHTPANARSATPLRSRLRRAWQRLAWTSIALQAALLLAVGALLAAWLSIPDSTPAEVVLTLLLATAGPVALLWAQTSLWRRIVLRRNALASVRAVLFTLACFLLFWLLQLLLLPIATASAAPAGATLLYTALSLFITFLVWIVLTAAALALAVVAILGAAATAFSLPAILRDSRALLRQPTLWPPLLLLAALATLATALTLDWHPAATESTAHLLGSIKVALLWLLLSIFAAFACSWIATFSRDR